MHLLSLGTLKTQILVVFQEYNDDRRSVANVFLNAVKELCKLLLNANCLMLSSQSTQYELNLLLLQYIEHGLGEGFACTMIKFRNFQKFLFSYSGKSVQDVCSRVVCSPFSRVIPGMSFPSQCKIKA